MPLSALPQEMFTLARSVQNNEGLDLIGSDELLEPLTLHQLLRLFAETEKSLNALHYVLLFEIHLNTK
jgi:hypothetical protein